MAEILHNLPGAGSTACTPTADTRAALLTLVSTNALTPGCWYGVTDANVGTLGPATIWLIALTVNEVSMAGHAEQTFEAAELWPVEYDLQADQLDTVHNPRNRNYVQGSSATVTFPWGDPNVTRCTIEQDGNFNYTAGGGLVVNYLHVGPLGVVDVQGSTGSVERLRVEQSASVLLAGHSLAISDVTVSNGANILTINPGPSHSIVMDDSRLDTGSTLRFSGTGGGIITASIRGLNCSASSLTTLQPATTDSTYTIQNTAIGTEANVLLDDTETCIMIETTVGNAATLAVQTNPNVVTLTGVDLGTVAILNIIGNLGTGTIALNRCHVGRSMTATITANDTPALQLTDEWYEAALLLTIQNNVSPFAITFTGNVITGGIFNVTNNTTNNTFEILHNMVEAQGSFVVDSNPFVDTTTIAENAVSGASSSIDISTNTQGITAFRNRVTGGAALQIQGNVDPGAPLDCQGNVVSNLGALLQVLTNQQQPLSIRGFTVSGGGLVTFANKTGGSTDAQDVTVESRGQFLANVPNGAAPAVLLFGAHVDSGGTYQCNPTATYAAVNVSVATGSVLTTQGGNTAQLEVTVNFELDDGGFDVTNVYARGNFAQTLTANNTDTARDYVSNSLV